MDTAEINEWNTEERKKEPEYAKLVYDKLIHLFKENHIHYTTNLNIRDSIDENWKTGMVKQLLYKDLLQYNNNKIIIGEDVLTSYSSFNKLGLNNPNSVIFINEHTRFLSLQEAIDLIHRNGGLCFLAHVYEYDVGNHIEFLDSLRGIANIDGIEVYHSSFSDNQIKSLINYADKNGLFKCGGSDFHGKLKPGYNLGLNMNISEELIAPWINNYDIIKN